MSRTVRTYRPREITVEGLRYRVMPDGTGKVAVYQIARDGQLRRVTESREWIRVIAACRAERRRAFLGIVGQGWCCNHPRPGERIHRTWQGPIRVEPLDGCWGDHEPAKRGARTPAAE